jgi:hypothetical protein
MENTERVLISQNDSLLLEICSDLRKYTPALNKLKTAYDLLELKPDFSDSLYKELVTSGTSRIIKVYMEDLNKQLDKSGIKNSNIRNVALAGADEPLQRLKDALHELKEVQPVSPYGVNPRSIILPLNQITYLEGAFVITDKDKEVIAETHCRIYLENDEDHKTYNILLDLQKSLKAFESMKVEKGLPNNIYGSYGQHISDFFGQNGELLPGSIDWVNQYQARIDAMNAASVKRQERVAASYQASLDRAGLERYSQTKI